MEKFEKYYQPNFESKSISMQNIKIRWNSIYDMFIQVMYLQKQIHVFIHQNFNFRLESFRLSQNEIQYIDYFIYILKSFKN